MFFEKLYNPGQRITLQPSLVLSALAVSILMKSSEADLGERGRSHALLLRDAAQSSLEASISTGWIEPSLAQAALVRTFTVQARTFETYLLETVTNPLRREHSSLSYTSSCRLCHVSIRFFDQSFGAINN